MYKVWLTGGTGMVGRNLREHPKAADHQVLAPNRKSLNLLDDKSVKEWVITNRPDIVIHAAGKVGGISANIEAPVEFLDINTRIGRNVLLAARDANVPRLINLSSSCFYPANANCPIKENQVLSGPLEPTNEGYAIAKIFAMRLCKYINQENKSLNYKTLIPCNLYGPWDDFSENGGHMLPAVVAKIHAAHRDGKNEVEIWGDGNARREFMYAKDVADGIWTAVNHFEHLPYVMNLGMGHNLSINDYYRVAAEVIGWKGTFVHNLDRPVGMKQKIVDISRQTQFGWQPSVPLFEGISLLYKHYLQFHT